MLDPSHTYRGHGIYINPCDGGGFYVFWHSSLSGDWRPGRIREFHSADEARRYAMKMIDGEIIREVEDVDAHSRKEAL